MTYHVIDHPKKRIHLVHHFTAIDKCKQILYIESLINENFQILKFYKFELNIYLFLSLKYTNFILSKGSMTFTYPLDGLGLPCV